MLKPSHGEGRTAPMSGMAEGGEPRYRYAKPTEKPQFGIPKAQGSDIADYNLPIIDVQTAKRNFPGYAEAQMYSLDEIRQGDTAGTTETDSQTDSAQPGYTKINSKAGLKDRWPTKRSK